MELISKLIPEDINNNSTLKKLYSEQGTKLDLAIVLVNLRKDIGWSKMQLAKKLSIPRTIIEMIENGDVLPTMTFLRLLAYVTWKNYVFHLYNQIVYKYVILQSSLKISNGLYLFILLNCRRSGEDSIGKRKVN